jgi:2-amino-4-hydroxy-6-hydroxymethyldihydropteridine diphosphokinase
MPSIIACIGMGSNLGDRRGTLEGAIAALARTKGIHVQKVSSFHETEPVGGPPGQAMYLNAAAVIETDLDPHRLLLVLEEIEAQFGRVRSVPWGERTLDLDLLLFDSQIVSTPELTVPHPRMRVRRFVLEPLAEIAPEIVDPITMRTIAEMLAEVEEGPS